MYSYPKTRSALNFYTQLNTEKTLTEAGEYLMQRVR